MKRRRRKSNAVPDNATPAAVSEIPKGESMNSKLTFVLLGVLALVLLIGVAVGFANIEYTQEGTVKVVTNFGRIERVYRPDDGWFTTLTPGRQAYEVNIKSFTETAPVRVTSKDNAALQVEISVTAFTDPQHVEEYVRKYGFDEAQRHTRRNQILHGLIQTEARNAFAEYGAYEIYANQESIQKRILDTLKPQLSSQLQLVTESVQIGN